MDSPPQEFSELVAGVRRRESAAAERLVEALYPVVLPVIQRRLPRGADARDLAQDTLLKILQGLEHYRGDGASLPAWARRIAFRTCLNEWRRRRSRPESLWSDLTEEQSAAVETLGREAVAAEALEASTARDVVRRLLETLRPEDRWVIELADLEGRSVEEIRALTGWSPLNLRVRRFRARRKLRAAWESWKESAHYE